PAAARTWSRLISSTAKNSMKSPRCAASRQKLSRRYVIMAKVVTFGEIMLRLAPNGYERFFQSDQLQATFGGGEANVAVSLANFGLESVYVTKLPAHAIGQGAVNSLRYFG